jgi:hypothetical protein
MMTNSSAAHASDDSLAVREIEYYLKLNRYGRCLLNSPNIIHGLWPRVLSPMADKPADVDALFFFSGNISPDDKKATCWATRHHCISNSHYRKGPDWLRRDDLVSLLLTMNSSLVS